MSSPELSQAESTLRSWIPALLKGEEQAVLPVRKCLHQIRPGYESTLPVLIILLDSPFDEIRADAANAIGSLRSHADSAVSALEQLLLEQRGSSSHAAAYALGNIHTESALQSLLGQLPKLNADYCMAALMQIERFGELAKDVLPQLQKFEPLARKLDRRVEFTLAQTVKSIIQEIKRAHFQSIDEVELPEAVRILRWHRGNERPEDFFSQYKEELSATGSPLLQCRYRFVTNQVNECNIAIHHGVQGQHVIVASHDRQSYGVIPSEVASDIATALTHTYKLNPYSLRFYTYTPAYSHFMHPAESRRIMLSYDEDDRVFRKIREESVKDLRAELLKIGIEL